VLQSGGPTSVLNASLAEIIRAGRKRFGSVLGSQRGFEGVADGRLVDLTDFTDEFLDRLARTPSAGLGTSRLRPDDEQLDAIVERLKDNDVSAVIGIGGNDTADTLLRLEAHARERGAGLRVISLPKTIDNDLAVTDHSLGYPSAARVVAAVTRDALVDTLATATLYPLKIVEVMGRNAGWLAASAGLWTPRELPAPLIVLPERPFHAQNEFLQAIQARVDAHGFAVVAAPETMRWADGTHVSGDTPEWLDAFGHPYHPSAGQALLRACGEHLGLRGKLDRPGSISRSSIDYAATVDLVEAAEAGRFAVESLESGASGRCIVITRTSSNPYGSDFDLAPLDLIANVEVRIPDELIDDATGQPSARFTDYALPLLGPSTTDYAFIDWNQLW